MPADPKAFARLAERIRSARTVEDRDSLLDAWVDYRDRATEWDADQWGLDYAGEPFVLPDVQP